MLWMLIIQSNVWYSFVTFNALIWLAFKLGYYLVYMNDYIIIIPLNVVCSMFSFEPVQCLILLLGNITRREPRPPGNVHIMMAVIPPSQLAENYHMLHSLMLWQHLTTYFYFVMIHVFIVTNFGCQRYDTNTNVVVQMLLSSYQMLLMLLLKVKDG